MASSSNPNKALLHRIQMLRPRYVFPFTKSFACCKDIPGLDFPNVTRGYKGLQGEKNSAKTFDWAFLNVTGPSAQHQSHSRAHAVFVLPIQGRATHLDPNMVPTHEQRYPPCGTQVLPGPLPSLQTAAAQHAGTIPRLRTRNLRIPNRNNKVTLHTILLGAGTIYDDYTIAPLVELGLTRHISLSIKCRERGKKGALGEMLEGMLKAKG
eukprot:1143435-Pelagomonas_calceolata.AAC.1